MPLTPAKKAALTRKRRAAGVKAAATRKRRATGRKAAATRKRRATARKAWVTRKRRAAAIKAVATRRAKRGSQGREQTVAAEPPSRETILEVGAEGGSLTILRTRAPEGAWRFVLLRNELVLFDPLDGDDRQDFYDESGSVGTFAAALQLMSRYPWHRLYPVKVHEEYAVVVMAEVLRRGGTKEVARWKSVLSRWADHPAGTQ